MLQWLQVQTLGVEGGCGYLMEYEKLCSHTALKFMVAMFPGLLHILQAIINWTLMEYGKLYNLIDCQKQSW